MAVVQRLTSVGFVKTAHMIWWVVAAQIGVMV